MDWLKDLLWNVLGHTICSPQGPLLNMIIHCNFRLWVYEHQTCCPVIQHSGWDFWLYSFSSYHPHIYCITQYYSTPLIWIRLPNDTKEYSPAPHALHHSPHSLTLLQNFFVTPHLCLINDQPIKPLTALLVGRSITHKGQLLLKNIAH